MYQIKIRNSQNGEEKELTNLEGIEVTGLQGINPPPANVNVSRLADGNSGIYEITTRDGRQIIITLTITKNIERAKEDLNKFFALDIAYKIMFTKNNKWYEANKAWEIDGYIQSIEYDDITQGLSSYKYQIAIKCPVTYFSSIIGKQSGPPGSVSNFVLQNDGDIPCGFNVTAVFKGTCSYVSILREGVGGLNLNRVFAQGDVLEFDTRFGRKTIKVNDKVDFSYAMGTEFITLNPGPNNMTMTFSGGAPSNVIFSVYALKRGL